MATDGKQRVRVTTGELLPALPRVVVVGAGFAGLAIARRIDTSRSLLTVIDRRNHHLFQPLLYQVAMAGLSSADISIPIRSMLGNREGANVVYGEVINISVRDRLVHLLDGAHVPFDILVVAAGSSSRPPRKLDPEGHALPLKSAEDALAIRQRMLVSFEAAERARHAALRRRLATSVVVGGGPTGVELCGAMAELSRILLRRDFSRLRYEEAQVLLLEREDRLLPTGFGPELSERTRVDLEALGVRVKLGTSVKRIDEEGVSLEDGTRIEANTVIWTAGAVPSKLASSLGFPLDSMGRVLVDEQCRASVDPPVYVVGDMAAFGEKPGSYLPLTASVALQQGRYVGSAINGVLQGKTPPPFRFRDRGMMATIGRSRAVATFGGMKVTGFLAWLLWLLVHLYYLIGFRNRVAVFLSWLWNYSTYRPGARIITAAAGDSLGEGASGSAAEQGEPRPGTFHELLSRTVNPTETGTGKSPPSVRRDKVDQASYESFPASDPPGY